MMDIDAPYISSYSVGGIFYGWPAYIYVLKEEGVFRELCNETQLLATNQTSCVEQDTKFNSIFITACLLSNVFGTVFGLILDKFGLLSGRICTAIPMTIGKVLWKNLVYCIRFFQA